MMMQDVLDSGGRVLTLRRLTALDRLRLYKAIGAVLAENAPYLGMALLAISVMAIDGVPIPLPGSEGQLEGILQRLGDAGIEAVAAALEAAEPALLSEADAGN